VGLAATIALAGLPAETGALAAAALERGEFAFEQCCACHAVGAGEGGSSGPDLAGVVGRAIASLPGFDYPDVLAALPARGDRVWTAAALDAFLIAPREFAPGTAMISSSALRDATERADLMAYVAAPRDGFGRG
jgi:cytochrome c